MDFYFKQNPLEKPWEPVFVNPTIQIPKTFGGKAQFR
jgi:hypothetical protein